MTRLEQSWQISYTTFLHRTRIRTLKARYDPPRSHCGLSRRSCSVRRHSCNCDAQSGTQNLQNITKCTLWWTSQRSCIVWAYQVIFGLREVLESWNSCLSSNPPTVSTDSHAPDLPLRDMTLERLTGVYARGSQVTMHTQDGSRWSGEIYIEDDVNSFPGCSGSMIFYGREPWVCETTRHR